MSLRDQLIGELHSIVKGLGADFLPVVETPGDLIHGDFTTNAAMILAKSLKQNPLEVAEEIAGELRISKRELKFIEKIEVVKPGFINFWLSSDYLREQLSGPENSLVALQNIGKGKSVIVEYSSPNIAKPFTIGHLRSTIIGDALANLLEAVGFAVKRDNHLGDWGTQFGKQIYAIKEWGNEGEIEKSDRPVKILVDLYVRFHQEAEKDPELEEKARVWFKKLEDGDPEAKRLWQKCIDWSWKEFDAIYKKLDVAFTENNGRGYGESFFEDKMTPVIKELEEKKLLKESEEAKLVFFPQEKYPPLMIIKKDGATLYATRDLATDKFRKEKYGDDIIIINEVGIEQSLYFQQLYEVEEMLSWFKKDQRVHIKHGLYRFKDEKMSTRKGNVIWLEDVLEEAEKRARVIAQASSSRANEESVAISQGIASSSRTPRNDSLLAKIVAIGALKWNDLKRDSKQNILFDWDDILNMQGNSGPYLQYTYARTQSVLRKAKPPASGAPFIKGGLGDLSVEEKDLLRLLVRFSDVVSTSAEKFAPNILCNYLFVLAQSFNLFYQKHQILNAEQESRDFRLSLTRATGNVIKSGLNLLGIAAPDKM